VFKRYRSYSDFLKDIGGVSLSEKQAQQFVDQSKTLKVFASYIDFENDLLEHFEREFPEYDRHIWSLDDYRESLEADGDIQVIAAFPDGRVAVLWLEDCEDFDKEIQKYTERR